MTPTRYRQVVELFEAACALAPEARAQLLAERCGGDAGLLRDVEAMLEQDARRSLLRTTGGTPPALLALEALEGKEAPLPERLGAYRILGVLGTGAMGTVYRAEQQQPRREVALKTIHWWLLSPAAIERLRFEAQALAQLQHPGIPQVYEVAEDVDRIAFAMELVDGPPLSAYVTSLDGDVRRVVEVLARIADAVHHAHLRGLVHRDLKPENVRVQADGQPKVLDFGIAQVLDARGVTARAKEISGTLAYMAPEQLTSGERLDIRADVYALGVIAYELLGGQRPFALAGLDLEQARTRVLEAPVRPLWQLRPSLPRDLSAVVARAMARRREERYGSAAELASELRRFLRHQPVRAHPGGGLYRAARFVRRNGLAVALGTSVILALGAGGGVSFHQFRQAEAARMREAELRVQAEAARDSATHEAAKSKATVDFLSQLLLEAAPTRAMGTTVTVREALDKAAQRLEKGSLESQPDVEAQVRLTLAQAYRSLGLEAETHAQVVAAAALAQEGRLQGRHEGAEPLLALADVSSARGEFAVARKAIQQSLEIERAHHRDGPHVDLSRALYIAGQIAMESGALEQARTVFEEALALGRTLAASGAQPEGEIGNTLNQLGQVHAHRGAYAQARTLFDEAMAIDLRLYGAEHPEIATNLHNLAWLALESERAGEAQPHLARALEIRSRVLGPRHPRVALQLALHAAVALSLDEVDEAERLTRESLAILAEAYGPLHPHVIRNRGLEAKVHLRRGRLAEAQDAAEAAHALHRERYGDQQWITADASTLIARILAARGRSDEARTLLEASLPTLRAQVGPEARATREAEALLAELSPATPSRSSSVAGGETGVSAP